MAKSVDLLSSYNSKIDNHASTANLNDSKYGVIIQMSKYEMIL